MYRKNHVQRQEGANRCGWHHFPFIFMMLTLVALLIYIVADFRVRRSASVILNRKPKEYYMACVCERLLVNDETKELIDESGMDVIPFMIVPLMLDIYDFQDMMCNISVPIRRLFLVQNMEEPVLTSYLNEMEESLGWSGRLLLRRHPENIGYSGAVNEGLRFAMSLPREEAPFVFVTNSDVEFSPDLLPQLLRDVHNLTAHDAARMDELAKEVSREPSAYSPPNRPLKVLRSSDGNGIVSTSALLPDRIRYAPRDERVKAFADHYGVFCLHSESCFTSVFLSRLVISTVGFFDENFYPAYFEDVDYLTRVQLIGFKTYKQKLGNFVHRVGLNLRVMTDSKSHLSRTDAARWLSRAVSLSPTYRYAFVKWKTTKVCCLNYDEPHNGYIPLDVWIRDDMRINRVREYGHSHFAIRPIVLYEESLLNQAAAQ